MDSVAIRNASKVSLSEAPIGHGIVMLSVKQGVAIRLAEAVHTMGL